jgi:hypothetical protein
VSDHFWTLNGVCDFRGIAGKYKECPTRSIDLMIQRSMKYAEFVMDCGWSYLKCVEVRSNQSEDASDQW